MQIKMTLRHHLTPVRMSKIKNINNSLCWRGCGARGTFLHCWWECKFVQPLWKSVWWFLKILGINILQNPAILGIYPKDANPYHKHICSTLFIAALFVIARTWKQSTCSTEEQVKKCDTFTQWSTTQWLKKLTFLKFSGKWMGLEKNHPE